MSDITLTASRIAAVHPRFAEIYDFVAAATITAGQIVYLNSDGKLGVADANGSGTLQPLGVALNGGGAGQAISVLKRGFCYGFTITSLAYDAAVYLSDTAGALADAAGSASVIVGRVKALSDSGTPTKVLYIDAPWLTIVA